MTRTLTHRPPNGSSPDVAAAPGARACLGIAGLLGGSGVAMGALTAHLPDRLLAEGGRAMAHSAVEMQMWHAIALLALGLAGPVRRMRAQAAVACGFALGAILFCLPVYALAFRLTTLGAVAPPRLAPWGGTILIVSWLVLAAGAVTAPRPRS